MKRHGERQSEKRPWALLAVLVFLVLLFLPYAVFQGGTLAPLARQLVLILTAVFCSLLLLTGTQAIASGKLFSIRFRIVGAGASFVIFYLLFLYVIPKSDTRLVRIYLEHGGQPLLMAFSVNVRVPGMETIRKSGEDGETSIEIPSHVTEVDNLAVACIGYEVRAARPFRIENGVLRVPMIRAESPPPLRPDEFPPPSAIPDLPSKAVVFEHRPSIDDPAIVTLEYRNISDQNLRLLIFDCWRYYKSLEASKTTVAPWQDFPFEVRDEFIRYNGFRAGTGWFCFFVRDSTGRNTYLGRRNLFEKETTRLTVKGPASNMVAVFD